MERNTSTPNEAGDSDDHAPKTPAELREMQPEHDDETVEDPTEVPSQFLDLFLPPTRIRIVDALMGASSEALTVSQIEEQTGITPATFSRHKSALLPDTGHGLIKRAGKVGNAQTYELNDENPIVQALRMVDRLRRHGQTPQLVDEEFLGEVEYEPGNHPNDPR